VDVMAVNLTNPVEALTCKVMNRPATATVYTKREADRLMEALGQRLGGVWFIEKMGRNHRVYQSITNEEKQLLERRQQAEFILSDRCDWFSPNGIFQSIYKTRDRLKAELDKFQERFAENPVYALENSIRMFEVAAEYEVVCRMIHQYSQCSDAERVCKHLEEQASRLACSDRLEVSSSPSHNLMEAAKRIATTKYARDMRDWLNIRAQAMGDLYGL
jgi:hypothetical protein